MFLKPLQSLRLNYFLKISKSEFDGEHILCGTAREVLVLLYITQFYKSILCLNDHINGKQSNALFRLFLIIERDLYVLGYKRSK